MWDKCFVHMFTTFLSHICNKQFLDIFRYFYLITCQEVEEYENAIIILYLFLRIFIKIVINSRFIFKIIFKNMLDK
jgi:hypothetical protein